jgi:hypothetical protein
VLVEQGALPAAREQLVAIPYSLPIPLPVAVEPVVVKMQEMRCPVVLAVEHHIQARLDQETPQVHPQAKVTTAAQIQVVTMAVVAVAEHLLLEHLLVQLLAALEEMELQTQ